MNKHYKGYNNYDLHPVTSIDCASSEAAEGYGDILARLSAKLQGKRTVLVCDLYPGVNKTELVENLSALNPGVIIDADCCKLSDAMLVERFKGNITDDRVFGRMSCADISECFDHDKLTGMRGEIEAAEQGLIIVIGVAASLLCKGDVLVYCDMPRWEIQLRYRTGMPNWMFDNGEVPTLTKYKIGFFIEWRMADRHKMSIFEKVDYFIDTTLPQKPKLASGKAVREGLFRLSQQPFRLQPYFDPGVWGGQWMKETLGLPSDSENYAWSFDGVPEENSINLRFGTVTLEFPAINLVLRHPKELLGQRVYDRFGAEFPIRFDLLDTMDGGNLSLQVHPITDYIKRQFGMKYTQDESYYMLDAKEDAGVYLGVKEGIDRKAMIADLKLAEAGEGKFPDEKYINRFPAKKHDHFSIPAGTVHCSGSGGMVLEISATPYIFTFKLWDWDRLGLDGVPRPVHIEHGEQVIQWDRDTKWVENNLIDRVKTIAEGNGWQEEHTGLHELEFIETRRYWISGKVTLSPKGSVDVFNLVEGKEAVVRSATDCFAPFTVHYAETFIIPASAGAYIIESGGDKIGIIRAYVRE